MNFTRLQFQQWGAQGGRIRAQRLSKAKRRQIAKAAGSAPKRGRGRPAGGSAVNLPEAISLYKEGKTLEELGEKYGVTRERVRQMLAKAGITREDGGQAIKSLLRVPERIEAQHNKEDAQERRCLKKWGITREQYVAIKEKYGAHGDGARNAFARYEKQRQSARQRKIAFELTFSEWLSTWEESGHYDNIGRGHGKYCMARYGDIGAYKKGNILIIPSVENSSDRVGKRNGLPIGVGVHIMAGGRKRFMAVKMVKSKRYHIGSFATPEEASAAYQTFMPRRAKRDAK